MPFHLCSLTTCLCLQFVLDWDRMNPRVFLVSKITTLSYGLYARFRSLAVISFSCSVATRQNSQQFSRMSSIPSYSRIWSVFSGFQWTLPLRSSSIWTNFSILFWLTPLLKPLPKSFSTGLGCGLESSFIESYVFEQSNPIAIELNTFSSFLIAMLNQIFPDWVEQLAVELLQQDVFILELLFRQLSILGFQPWTLHPFLWLLPRDTSSLFRHWGEDIVERKDRVRKSKHITKVLIVPSWPMSWMYSNFRGCKGCWNEAWVHCHNFNVTSSTLSISIADNWIPLWTWLPDSTLFGRSNQWSNMVQP